MNGITRFNSLHPAALDGFLKAVGQAYDFSGLIDIPDDRLFLANVSPQFFKAPFSMDSLRNGDLMKQLQGLNLTEVLASISNTDLIQELAKQLEGQNITLQGLSNGDVLEQLAKQFTLYDGLNLTERIASAARQTAVDLNSQLAKASKAFSKTATERLQELQTQPSSSNRFQPLLQNMFSKFLGGAKPASPSVSATSATTAAAGRKLQSDDDAEPELESEEVTESPEEAAEKIAHLNSIRASLRELTKLARAQALLEQPDFGLLNGTTEGKARRKLSQKAGGPLAAGAAEANNGQAYRVIFSNIFDFFYDATDDGDPDSKFLCIKMF